MESVDIVSAVVDDIQDFAFRVTGHDRCYFRLESRIVAGDAVKQKLNVRLI